MAVKKSKISFARCLAVWLCLNGCSAAVVVLAQQETNVDSIPSLELSDNVGGAGSVGAFEAADPVLNDEVSMGVIPSSQNWFLFGKPDGGGVYGWLDAGFVGNVASPASKFNGPYNAVDRANEAMANQVYLIGERLLPTDN